MSTTSLQARLYFAGVLGDVDCVKHLLAAGAKPRDESYEPPLVVTVRQGQFMLAQLLIEADTGELVVLSQHVSEAEVWSITTMHRG